MNVPIEMRDPSEVTFLSGKNITVKGVKALNPAFDITPPELITGIITEYGIIKPPFDKNIKSSLGKSS